MAECFVFNKKTGIQTDVELIVALEAAKNQENTVWINLLEPSNDELQTLGQSLAIHELTMEDLENPKVRPKVEDFDEYLFVVFKAMNFNEGEDLLNAINLNLLLFKNILISVHLKPLLSINDLIKELKRKPTLMQKGVAFLLYRLLDRIVDRYFPLMEELDEKIDEIQSRIFGDFDKDVSETIFEWKTKVATLKRSVGPQREMLMNLANRPQTFINAKTQVYLRDVYDHIVRIHDNMESYRDILQGAMDSFMTQVSNHMNEVMKVLSIVATIMLPLGILTGLYGTNFEQLPGSQNPHSFWIFVCLMVALVVGATLYFKAKKWF